MIALSHVCKTFIQGDERIEALRDFSLHVKKGECVVLKGASGSGKSTLLSLIAGLCYPSSGSVVVDGKEISCLPEPFSARLRREKIGFIFQKYHLISYLSVQENVMAPLIPETIPLRSVEERAKRAMERSHIAHKATQRISALSGGEQQRVAIARALVNDPVLILADEPTANLDEKLSYALIEEFRALKEGGKTLLIATHDPLFFDLSWVDRMIEMKHGARVE